MSEVRTELSGTDLVQGVALSIIADGAMLLGHAGESALLARTNRIVHKQPPDDQVLLQLAFHPRQIIGD